MSTPTEQTNSAIDDIQWQHPNAIVECDWLKDHIGNTSLRIYDCTTYLHYTDDHPSKPYDVVSGLAQYSKAHISNSAYLELQKDLSLMRIVPTASPCQNCHNSLIALNSKASAIHIILFYILEMACNGQRASGG